MTLPRAVFVRLGVGERVPFPLLPNIERTKGVGAFGPYQNPATVLTWGALRVVFVWPRS